MACSKRYSSSPSMPKPGSKPNIRRWPDYNGCMLIPEFMARAGEAGRDNHLQACGAFADTTAAQRATTAGSNPGQNSGNPTAIATPGGGAPLPVATGSTPGGNSPGTSVAATQRVRANDTAGNPDQCQPPPPPASLSRGSFAGSGVTPRISGDTLSFHDQPPSSTSTTRKRAEWRRSCR